MATVASDLFGSKKQSDVSPINVVQPRETKESKCDNTMAIRTRDEDRIDRIENAIEALVRAQSAPVNGEKRRMNWFMASIAAITILGAGGNFVGSSGMWIGNRNRDAEDIKTVKDEIANLRTWNEKLRNNMSAYGWLIDNEGNVNRIEETVKPKRR